MAVTVVVKGISQPTKEIFFPQADGILPQEGSFFIGRLGGGPSRMSEVHGVIAKDHFLYATVDDRLKADI